MAFIYRKWGKVKIQGTRKATKAVVIHHTGGHKMQDAFDDWKTEGIGAHVIVDRDGKIYELAARNAKVNHTKPSGSYGPRLYEPRVKGISNDNSFGIEIVAEDNSKVTKEQLEAVRRYLVEDLGPDLGIDPVTQVWGHGEVTPGRKRLAEGQAVVQFLRTGVPNLREKDDFRALVDRSEDWLGGSWQVDRQTAFTSPPTVYGSRSVKRGMWGDDVGYLQQTLKQADYYTGRINNVFDEQTERALKTFQKAWFGRLPPHAAARGAGNVGYGYIPGVMDSKTFAKVKLQERFNTYFDPSFGKATPVLSNQPGQPDAPNLSFPLPPRRPEMPSDVEPTIPIPRLNPQFNAPLESFQRSHPTQPIAPSSNPQDEPGNAPLPFVSTDGRVNRNGPARKALDAVNWMASQSPRAYGRTSKSIPRHGLKAKEYVAARNQRFAEFVRSFSSTSDGGKSRNLSARQKILEGLGRAYRSSLQASGDGQPTGGAEDSSPPNGLTQFQSDFISAEAKPRSGNTNDMIVPTTKYGGGGDWTRSLSYSPAQSYGGARVDTRNDGLGFLFDDLENEIQTIARQAPIDYDPFSQIRIPGFTFPETLLRRQFPPQPKLPEEQALPIDSPRHPRNMIITAGFASDRVSSDPNNLASYGRRYKDGKVRGTTRSGSRYTSSDGGRSISVTSSKTGKTRSFVKNRRRSGYALRL